MMVELSPNEKDVLNRINHKPKLQPIFFQKVKGVKWFYPLYDAGYFDPERMPPPKVEPKTGYVTIPRWIALDYLVKTAPELKGTLASAYAPQFLDIIGRSTRYAKQEGFGNYHVWWQFAMILSKLPHEYIKFNDVVLVDYWLEDNYDTELVVEEISNNWVPQLLEKKDAHAQMLAWKLLRILLTIRFVTRKLAGRDRREASFRFSGYRGQDLVEKVALLSGRRLGRRAVYIFHAKIIYLFDTLEHDTWSSIWRPAIEEHEQNLKADDPEQVLVSGFRDSLQGYTECFEQEAYTYVSQLLGQRLEIVRRIAIHCISRNPHCFSKLWDSLICLEYLRANYRHEMWHFLNICYPQFTAQQKKRMLKIIEGIKRVDERGEFLPAESAFEKSIWLSAIKEAGEEEAKLYREAAIAAGTEPEHPDFSSYMSSGWVVPESPYSVEELSSLSIDELSQVLAGERRSGRWGEPGIEGLAEALKQVLMNMPLRYCPVLERFKGVDLAFVAAVIEAYGELWTDKAKLPWDEVWGYLLTFVSSVIAQKSFWAPENAKPREGLVANRYGVVSAIGRLLEAGTKTDDHAFDERYLGCAEKIVRNLLRNQEGAEFAIDRDAVTIAINSARGRCIEALINLTLRACRLQDRQNDGQHVSAWMRFQPYYDAELQRASEGEYEFATLVTNYLPNFLYMSREWVLQNLGKIFEQQNYLEWICAMQGYSYVTTVYAEIYRFLREHGDFARVLDDENLKGHVENRVVQQIVVAFISDFEDMSAEGSLIARLISRGDYEELYQLVWFMWTLRKRQDARNQHKAFELWPKLLDILNFESERDKKLASTLCLWATFVEQVDLTRKNWLLEVAPYAHVSYNAYAFLRNLAHISEEQPFEANEIWQKMLEGAAPDYPEWAIRRILTNLVSKGREGQRAARKTVSLYVEKGVHRPADWLREITNYIE